jgi:large subunit ribosomal protein L13
MKTYMQKTAEVKRDWHLVDAKNEVLGRLATQIATKLIGKDKPTYTPHIDGGDFVVVINAKDVVLTRNKANTKVYTHNTGFPGGQREIPFSVMIEKHPERVVEMAVYNMLPKNKLRDVRMTRLKVYGGPEHTHQSQLGTAAKAE